jgi:hypothetical protein
MDYYLGILLKMTFFAPTANKIENSGNWQIKKEIFKGCQFNKKVIFSVI